MNVCYIQMSPGTVTSVQKQSCSVLEFKCPMQFFLVIMSKAVAMSTLGAEHVWKSLSLLFIMLLT